MRETAGPDVRRAHARWRPLLWALVAVSLLMVALSAVVPLALAVGPVDRTSPVRVFFDVSGERNLPAWWNAGLLSLAAALAFLAGWFRRPAGVDGRTGWIAWCGLGVLFAAMSLDETTGIHERLDGVWRRLAGENPLPAFEWLILGVPLAAAVVVVLWLCARVLPRQSTVLYLAGIGIFFLGAIGAESVVVATGAPLDSWGYVFSYHVEELLEFIGSALLVVAPLASGNLDIDPATDPGSGPRITWHAGRRQARGVVAARGRAERPMR